MEFRSSLPQMLRTGHRVKTAWQALLVRLESAAIAATNECPDNRAYRITTRSH